MAEKPDKEQQLKSLAEALKMEMIINQALIDVLVEKGILTHDEIMAKTREIKIKQGIVLSSEASNKASN
ncbi:MAG: nitrile hydratase subunit beta [Proteobacteria bacterium]|nr:nitrile hydratase subunit beta [Pseudomonadota bacterium]MBU4298072.1 nitrile hydratase subunit beta [Pseudomonadota bacterium]MCG2746308.1 nitrile hydratase subunit beta [Desulfobulbaceae bacterium]